VAAFYYLRLIKTMWFDAAPAGRTDRSPVEASGTAYVAALFATGVVFVLGLVEPLARTAATAFLGLG
jgi:NADH-quinone oxidoreductase subunit N